MLNKGICPSREDPEVRCRCVCVCVCVLVQVHIWPLKTCCVCSPFLCNTIDQLIKGSMTRFITVIEHVWSELEQQRPKTKHNKELNKATISMLKVKVPSYCESFLCLFFFWKSTYNTECLIVRPSGEQQLSVTRVHGYVTLGKLVSDRAFPLDPRVNKGLLRGKCFRELFHPK